MQKTMYGVVLSHKSAQQTNIVQARDIKHGCVTKEARDRSFEKTRTSRPSRGDSRARAMQQNKRRRRMAGSQQARACAAALLVHAPPIQDRSR